MNPKIYLNSRAIRAVQYESQTGKLLIWFPGRGPYTYVGVPASVYQGLIHAFSAGKFHAANIAGKYQRNYQAS